MTYRSEKSIKEGYAALDFGDCEYHIDIADYEFILDAYKNGKGFIEARTLFGETVTIKLAKVASITLLTPDSIIKRDLDEELRKAFNLVEDL